MKHLHNYLSIKIYKTRHGFKIIVFDWWMTQIIIKGEICRVYGKSREKTMKSRILKYKTPHVFYEACI